MLFDGLPDDASRVRLLRAVAGYAFDGLEPEDLTAVEMAVYKTIRRTVSNRKRSERKYAKKQDNLPRKAVESTALTSKVVESTAKNGRIYRPSIPSSNQHRNTDITPYSVSKDTHSPTGGNNPKKTVFRPPTLEEVEAYCRERNNNVDPHAFFDHYSANGWRVGRNPMKDFKAAIRYWERSEYGKKTDKPKRDYSGI
jgi:hypothetical protein